MSPETEATRTTEEVARSYFERVAARDPAGMMEHWRPGGIGHIYGLAELRAPDSYRPWFETMFRAFPDMQFEVLDITSDDERASVRWRARASFSGDVPFEGVEPNGAEVEMQGCDVLVIKDGKVTELHAYLNGTDMARQIGFLPAQGSPPERAMLGLFNLGTRAKRALQNRRS